MHRSNDVTQRDLPAAPPAAMKPGAFQHFPHRQTIIPPDTFERR